MNATSELKNTTSDTLRYHPSFYVFNHRGRVLFRSVDTTGSSNRDGLSSNTLSKVQKFESMRHQDFVFTNYGNTTGHRAGIMEFGVPKHPPIGIYIDISDLIFKKSMTLY